MALLPGRQQRQMARAEKQQARQMGKEERVKLRQQLKTMPLEHRRELMDAMREEGFIDANNNGIPDDQEMEMEGPALGGRELRGSPVGGRAPFGLGRVVTTVPAGSTGTLSQLPQIISPSYYRATRLIVTPRTLPAGIAGFLTALNIGTFNQFASLGESGFEAYDPLLQGGEISIQDITFGIPIQLIAVLTNSTAGPIDVAWGATLYGMRLG